MDKKDTIVTDVVIQALKMDDSIKRQEIIIERLKSENKDLLSIISRMKNMLVKVSPDLIKQLEMFNL